MTTKPRWKLADLEKAIRDEADWIKSRGGSLTGYIITYGSKHDDKHAGDGGEAIYEADMAKLESLIAERPRARK